jgi:hypothetical protein
MPPVPGHDNTRTPSSASLIPMAFVAVGVLVVALIVSGKTRHDTIVVQRIAIGSSTSRGGKTFQQRTVSVTAITEVSANGNLQRSFTSNSITRLGFQQTDASSTLQLYDPVDNTIYVTTERAELRAAMAPLEAHPSKGTTSGVGVGKMQAVSASSVGYLPGTSSPYEQWLHKSGYKLAGRATIDGRTAIELVQPVPVGPPKSGSFASRVTVYLAPRSHDPIETVDNLSLSGMRATSVERWQTYRVLPATPANLRLLSLTDRHPHARVVDNAMAFLRASESEIRTTTVRTG